MKETIKRIALATALLVAPTLCSEAQTFYGLTTMWGTNAAPILRGFQTQSNLNYVAIQPQTLIVTNINTNESITVAYLQQQTGITSPNAVTNSSTNFYLTMLTTNFPASAGWTNGATWTFTIPGATYYYGASPWGYLAISNGQYASGSCTNGVGLQ